MVEKKRKKTPTDINILAKSIVTRVTHEELLPETVTEQLPIVKEKNPAAVALGRLGGLKGGRARAEKLSAKRRKKIAQKAAKARWDKKV
jgi:hypothetical protein